MSKGARTPVAQRFPRELDYRARHDLLTDLLNRTEAIRRLESLLSHPDPRAGHTGVLFVDVDRFNQVITVGPQNGLQSQA